MYEARLDRMYCSKMDAEAFVIIWQVVWPVKCGVKGCCGAVVDRKGGWARTDLKGRRETD